MDIRMIYEGKDITRDVVITKCVHRDVSRGKCDMLELELDHAATWYKWDPQRDETIEISCGGYSTGKLYLNTIKPEQRHFRILATALPSGSRQKKYDSFEQKTLMEIGARCAAECGLGFQTYGISGGLEYPYLLRAMEGSAEFLSRLAAMEGAALKIVNGACKLIGIQWAQALPRCALLHITTKQQNCVHCYTEHGKFGGIRVVSPFAQASAADATARGYIQTRADLPVRDSAQAGRWARGLLISHNREADMLTLTDAAYNPALTAMAHVTVDGDTDAKGEWLIDEVEHDFFNGRDTLRLLRFVTGIG